MDQGLPPQELEPVKASDAKLSVEELGAIESKNSLIILEATRRKIRSQQIVVSNIFWAVSLGAIPVPMVDVAATTAIQMKMISELSLQYDVRFSKNRVRAILASLGGGASIIGLSWLKIVPGHGTVAAGLYMGLICGAVTYAVGQLFIDHFESGGTAENFHVKQARKRMKQLITEGKHSIKKRGMPGSSAGG